MSRRRLRTKPKTVKTVRGFRRVVKLVRVTRKIITAGPFYESLGGILSGIRKAAGLTQADVSERVGLSRASIANIEVGRQRIPLDDLFVFAKALEIKPSKLFEKIEKAQP